jgi:hypothetical protein
VPSILRQLPFFVDPTTVNVQGDTLPIKAHQIVTWVSVTRRGRMDLPPNPRRFPAIIDIGHTHNFSLSEHHLLEWAGLRLSALPRIGRIRHVGRTLPLVGLNLWLLPNLPGLRDVHANRSAFGIELDSGIAVYPRGTPNPPRLPLLGLRALRRAELLLFVDCQKCRVDLRTPRRFWFFW